MISNNQKVEIIVLGLMALKICEGPKFWDQGSKWPLKTTICWPFSISEGRNILQNLNWLGYEKWSKTFILFLCLFIFITKGSKYLS